MKTIKTTVATTLPDQVRTKFTQEALADMRDQINNSKEGLLVYDIDWNEIGKVKKASIPEKDLVITMKIDENLIDKSFEWFFVPYGIPIDIKVEGDFEVTRKVDLKCIQMVKMPTDLSLKPIRFEMEFVEGVDYFVEQYDELTPELIAEYIKKGNQVSVYYPASMEWDNIIKDAIQKGLVADKEDGTGVNFVFPFNLSAVSITFEDFKKQVATSWQKYSSQKKEEPLKNHTEIQ